MRRSLDWLRGESQGNRRYAAVLILREMAENAPAVFNVHVQSFIEIIWAGLRDVKVIVREASVAALRVRQLPFPYPMFHLPFVPFPLLICLSSFLPVALSLGTCRASVTSLAALAYTLQTYPAKSPPIRHSGPAV